MLNLGKHKAYIDIYNLHYIYFLNISFFSDYFFIQDKMELFHFTGAGLIQPYAIYS